MKTANYFTLAILTLAMVGCAITGRISREQTGAMINHSTPELSGRIGEQRSEEHRRGFIEYYKIDGSTVYMLPPTDTPEGESLIKLVETNTITKNGGRIVPERSGKITVDFVVTLPAELMGDCRGVYVKPTLHKDGVSTSLDEISIRGELFSKVQKRNVWQNDLYNRRRNPDETEKRSAYERFVYYPYVENTRFDTVINRPGVRSYYYSQEVPTTDGNNSLTITLDGTVKALDHSRHYFPLSDTLQFTVSSMLDFTDTTTRYITKVWEKYATVNDRNYLHFAIGKAEIDDTLGDNGEQLAGIVQRMDEILNQKEFHVDSIVVTAMASPDGSIRLNERMSKARAYALRDWIAARFAGKGLDKMMAVGWIGEDWAEVERLLKDGSPMPNHETIYKMVRERRGQDLDQVEGEMRSHYPDDYKYLLDEIYPKTRAVNIRYDLRRVGMVKDIVHTFIPDTLYARGVTLMKERKYHDALQILEGFYDRNTAICMLSLDQNERAYNTLKNLPRNATHEYLLAIVCVRTNRRDEAMDHYRKAVELEPAMKERGELDPEIQTLICRHDGNPKAID